MDSHKILITPYLPSDADSLYTAAQADNHGVAAPTHIVHKNRNTVGYLSIGVVPTVLLWLNSKQCLIRDSLEVVSFYETYLKQHNVTGFLLPVPATSPMQPYVEKVGYQLASPNSMIYYKQLLPTGGQI